MLTFEEAKRLFDYDPETGVIRWKIRVSRNVGDGREAGNVHISNNGKSYRRVSANKGYYLAHRLIYLLQTGEWPSGQIDHIDGNGLNNVWQNLRAVTQSENGRNQRLPRTNTSGHVGVYWDKKGRKWASNIMVNEKTRHLGRFTSIEEAIAARKEAEIEHNFHQNHGTDRPL
jgi:hypothetical protein